jgi:uncharacterized membrane protein YuzA (DUF378 family)
MRFLPAVVVGLVAVAAVVMAVGDGSTATGVGLTLVGIAIVVAIAALFYLVGRSEDRERAREASRRR